MLLNRLRSYRSYIGLISAVTLGWWSLLPAKALPEDTGVTVLRSIQALGKIPVGRALLQKVEALWGPDQEKWLTRILPGEISRTESVLTRHLDPVTQSETKVREVFVYLKLEQGLQDALMDLAHELTHATAKPTWDPYQADLTLGEYIWQNLEGDGGEIYAVYHECQAADEMQFQTTRCERYQKLKGSNRLTQITKDFYKTGEWADGVTRTLGTDLKRFPFLNNDRPELYSATGGKPYPAALWEEFSVLTSRACENSKRRLQSITSDEQLNRTKSFIVQRCQKAD